jgi:DHA2 family multidrug resistance protein
MFDKGKELDWFESNQIIAMAVVAAVGFVVFLIWELTAEHPIVDLRLFARRNFTMGAITISVGYFLFFGNVVLMPLWLQQYMGYTATAAGMALAPVGLLAIIVSPIVGRTMGRVDPRTYASAAFVLFALVFWMRSQFTTQVDMWTILVPTIVQGAAVACFFIPMTGIALSGLSPDRIPAASGLSNFARITAGAFGTSISTTLWDSRATLHHAHMTERLASGDPVALDALSRLTAAGFSPEQAAAQINRLIDQQAFTRAADDVFYGSAMLFIVLIALVWTTRRQRGAASADAAGAH